MAQQTPYKTKSGVINCMKAVVDFGLNMRLKGGNVLYGVKTPDTYDITDMKAQILDIGFITEPVHISRREDGTDVVLRGNRRILASQELTNDPATPQGIKEALEKIPCIIYTGLTPEQERDLVNDQGQLKFRRSDLLNQLWQLQATGYNFQKLAILFWNQMADWTGNVAKAAEIRAINDPEVRRKEILGWLKTTLDQHILTIPYLGERVKKAMFLDTLKIDGLLKPTDEMPEFKMHASSSRTRELLAAKKEDGAAWTEEKGGPKFNLLIESFIKKDSGQADTSRKKTRMSSKDIEMREGLARSQLAKAVFKMTEGEPQESYQALDEQAYLWEQKTEAVMANLETLNPQAQEMFKAIFGTGTMVDFNLALQTYKS